MFFLKKIDLIIIVSLVIITFASRFLLLEKYQSHWDGPQYSIGITKYSFEQHTPAPFGYPVYIGFGRLFFEFVQEEHRSVLYVGLLFSLINSVLFYIAGLKIFNRTTGMIASLIFITSPTMYFFGISAYPYILVPAGTVMLALCTYYIIVKNKNLGILLGFLSAFFIGIRPQEAISMLPLVFFGLLNLQNKQRFIFLITFTIGILLIFIPQVVIVGGLEKYLSNVEIFIKQGALSGLGINILENHIYRVYQGILYTLGVSVAIVLLLGLYRLREFNKKLIINKKAIFFSFWIIPSLLTNIFVRSDHAGYQMVYLSGIILLISFFLQLIIKNRLLLFLIVILIAIFNLILFFRDRDPEFKNSYIQTSLKYSEVKKNDLQMEQKIKYILNNFDSRNTTIIVESQYFRPVMYHLKDYQVININQIETQESKFEDLIRLGRYWIRDEYPTKSREYIFDSSVKNIVFFNYSFYPWIGNIDKKVISLPYGSSMIILLNSGSYNYEYHKIKETK